MATEKTEKRDLRKELTEQIVSALEQGAAPWQKPWDTSTARMSIMPCNGVSGRSYHGGNALYLLWKAQVKGWQDPRWMTYKQAQEQGWQVRKGEKGTLVEYWQFEERRPAIVRDANGRPVLDKDGNTIPKIVNGERPMETVQLERPRVYHATVFNVSQIDGVPDISAQPEKWDPVSRGENILQASGAKISHDSDSAYYRPATDSIHLPPKHAFHDAAAYYGTALHELGHWTGHESRLARPGITGSHSFGSQEYAREELRAEIASWMLAAQTGIPHDPGNHTAYVGSWIKTLAADKNEIFRAAADAEKIVNHVLDMERQKEIALPSPAESVRQAVGQIVYWHNQEEDFYGYSLKDKDGKIIVKENFLSRDEMVQQLGEANAWSIDEGLGYSSEMSKGRDGVIQYGMLRGPDLDHAVPVLDSALAREQELARRMDGQELRFSGVEQQLAEKARPGHELSGPLAGPVVAENGQAVLQHLGRTNAAVHEKERLDRVPAVGENVKINYGRDGKAQVQSLDMGHEKALSR